MRRCLGNFPSGSAVIKSNVMRPATKNSAGACIYAATVTGLRNVTFACAPACLQVNQLSGLIELINGDLSKLDRKKLITLCTIDVHARDVLQRLIGEC